MGRTQVTKIFGRFVTTVGIILALLLAGGAPSDFGIRSVTPSSQISK